MSEENDNRIKRYVHTPVEVDHYGTKISIKANGRIVLSRLVHAHDGEDDEYDEIEVPASLIFKCATLLKATRSIEYSEVVKK